MNGGGNSSNPQQNPLAVALGFPNSGLTIFDPNRFRTNQAFIDDLRNTLDGLAEQNRIGLANFEIKARLEAEAERGRRAQEALMAIERGQVPRYNEHPSVPGPSTAVYSAANHTIPPYIYPVPPQYAPASPPQARIEEVNGSPNAERSSQNSRSSTSQHTNAQGIPPRSNMYAPQQNANSYAHFQHPQQWQSQRQDAIPSAVNPRHLQYYQAQNGQNIRPGYTGQDVYRQQQVNNSTPMQVHVQSRQGRPFVAQMADVSQNVQPVPQVHQQPHQMHSHSNTQYPAASNSTEVNHVSSSPPLPPPIDESRPATATQLRDTYNRYSASSSLANALVSPTDRVSSTRTGDSDSNRAVMSSQSTVGPTGTTSVSSDRRPTFPGVPQASNSLVRMSEQQPSSIASQVPNIGVTTTSQETGSNVAFGSGQTVQPVPNTLRHLNGMGSFRLTPNVQSRQSGTVPVNVPASSTNYTLADGHHQVQWADTRGTNIASYGSHAMEAGTSTRPTRAAAPAPPPFSYFKDPLTQARVPSGIAGLVNGKNLADASNTPVTPATPERQNSMSTPLTPASANKRNLAKSILRALGRPSKRKAEEYHSSSPSATSISPDDEPPLKRQAIDRPGPEPTELIQSRIDAEEAARDEITIPNGADFSATHTALTHGEAAAVVEAVHNEILSPNGADLGAVLPIPSYQEVTAESGTTEQDVQDLMEAFAHAAPVIVPTASPARPPSATLTADEHAVQEISSSSAQVVEEVDSVEAQSTAAPSSVPPGIASPTERPREEPFFESAFAPFEEDETPLFLPSPDLLPSAGPSLQIIDISKEMKASTSKLEATERISGPTPGLRVYVEVPTVTTWLRKRSKMSAKGKEKEIVSFSDMNVSPGKEPEQHIVVEAVESTTDDEQRQELARNAVKVASSRLRRRPCSWRECPAVLNTAEKLKAHAAEHVDISSKYTEGTIFPCRWKNCIRRFNKPEVLLQHLQNHVRKYILCSFEGCEEVFDHPLKLLTHIEGRHMNDKLRPSAELFERTPLARMPPLPSRMYTYHTVDLPVKQARMSSERRNRLGPWVFKRIFGPVNFDRTRQGGRYLMRPKGDAAMRATDKTYHTSFGKEDRRDRFHFLLRESPNQINCEDLDSVHVSELVERGLAFLPDKDGPQGPQEELLLTSLVQNETPGSKQEGASSSTARIPTPQRSPPSKMPAPPSRKQVSQSSEPQANLPNLSKPTEPEPADTPLKIDAPVIVDAQQPQLDQQGLDVVRVADSPSPPQDHERHAVTPLPETASDSIPNASESVPKPIIDLPEIVTLAMDAEVTAQGALDAELKSASAAGEEDTRAVEELV